MRKYSPLLFALIFLALLGRENIRAQTMLSLRGGVSLATLGGTDGEDVASNSRTGLYAGGAVTFNISEYLGIQIGAGYVQKGATENDMGYEGKVAADYIEVPLLLRVGIPTTGVISPHFLVGPAVSFEAKCEIQVSGGGVSYTEDCQDTRSIDFGAVGGAGLDIATSSALSITVDVLYNMGLRTLDDSDNPDDIKNRAWSFLAGVSLPIR